MLAVAEIEQMVLYQTFVSTDHGRLDVWVNGLLDWKAGVTAVESLTGIEQLDGQLGSWTTGISELLSDGQRRRSYEILDNYLADLLRESSEVLADSTDPMRDDWAQTASLLLNLFPGINGYYFTETDIFDPDSDFAMPLFAAPQRVELCGGLREFEIVSRQVDGERVVWIEHVRDDLAPGVGDPQGWIECKLADVVDYAGPGETRRVLELHLEAMGQVGDHLRYVINKVRAGARVTLPEMIRLRSFAASLLTMREEFSNAT